MRPVRSARTTCVLSLVGTVAVGLFGCGDTAKKGLAEADTGYSVFVPEQDAAPGGGVSLDLPDTGHSGAGGAGGLAPDALVYWEADAAPVAPPPASGPCTDGQSQACQAEGCAGGLQLCHGGNWGQCSPPPEACDGVDNNCDGQIDEAFPSLGQPCSAGGDCVGEGTFVCKADGSGVTCEISGGPAGSPEVCDGQDNDCDGEIDEDFPNERCCTQSADCGPGETCDDTGHCAGGGGGGGLDPGDPGLGFQNAPVGAPQAECDNAEPIPGPGEYPGMTGDNSDDGSCLFLPSGGGEQAFTIQRAEDTSIHLYAQAGFLTFVNTVLYVRTDCANPGSEIACNDDTPNDFLNSDAELDFVAQAGQTYTVIVDTWGAGGEFTLLVDEQAGGGGGGPDPQLPDAGVAPPPGPAEATCDAPIELPVNGTAHGNTDNGARAITLGCSSTDLAPESVFHYRADHAARVVFDTNGSDFDTVLGVRTGCDQAGTEFVCNDDNGGGGSWSQVAVDLNANEDYFVIVDGYDGTSGAVTVNATEQFAEICGPNGDGCAAGEACFTTRCAAVPAGLCADAIALRREIPVSGVIDGNTPSNVPSVGDCGGEHGAELVYAFVTENAGNARITLDGSDFDTVLSIYDACGQAVGGAVGCNDDSVGTASELQFPAEAGHMYFAIVEGYHGATGNVRITYYAP